MYGETRTEFNSVWFGDSAPTIGNLAFERSFA